MGPGPGRLPARGRSRFSAVAGAVPAGHDDARARRPRHVDHVDRAPAVEAGAPHRAVTRLAPGDPPRYRHVTILQVDRAVPVVRPTAGRPARSGPSAALLPPGMSPAGPPGPQAGRGPRAGRRRRRSCPGTALDELQSRLYCLQAALEDVERDLAALVVPEPATTPASCARSWTGWWRTPAGGRAVDRAPDGEPGLS